MLIIIGECTYIDVQCTFLQCVLGLFFSGKKKRNIYICPIHEQIEGILNTENSNQCLFFKINYNNNIFHSH